MYDNIASKNDYGKPRFNLLPWDAIGKVQKVLEYGAVKYSPRDWEKGFTWLRLFNAAMRHLTTWETGEDIDPDTGEYQLLHLAEAACCILFLLSHHLRQIGEDDRCPK